MLCTYSESTPEREAAQRAREAIRQLALDNSSVSENLSNTQSNPAGPPISNFEENPSHFDQNTMENQKQNDYSLVPGQGNEEYVESFQNVEENEARNAQTQSLGPSRPPNQSCTSIL